MNDVREIVIEPGITLAYKVCELNVDVDSGEIIPIMTRDHSGGFLMHSKANARVFLIALVVYWG